MRPDVLVVGGGVAGVCAAYYLARDGCCVTLLERGEVASGCSYGNSGLLVPSHSIPLAAPGVLRQGLRWLLDPESPFYVKPRPSRELIAWLWRFRAACNEAHVRRALPVLRDLGYASLALYRELVAVPGLDFGFRQDGALLVFRTETRLQAGRHEARVLEAAGITAKVLDGPAARALEPALRADLAGAVHFPDDAHLIPDRFVRGLAAVAEGLGVSVRPGTEVLGFTTRGRRIASVETTRGSFTPGEVVLAAGSWSSGIARGLGLRLPIQPAKGYSVTYERPAGGPRIPLLLGEARMAVTPMGDALRFGGTLELAGLDLSINRRRLAAIQRGPANYLTLGEELRLREIWRGLRPCTPDGLPLLGRPPQWENLVVATGHAMIGVSLGPVTGRLVAQLVAHERPSLDLGALDPSRFA